MEKPEFLEQRSATMEAGKPRQPVRARLPAAHGFEGLMFFKYAYYLKQSVCTASWYMI